MVGVVLNVISTILVDYLNFSSPGTHLVNADVFMQPSNNRQLSDEVSDTEQGTDVQHSPAGQLSANADFIIDLGSYVAGGILTQEETLHNFDQGY